MLRKRETADGACEGGSGSSGGKKSNPPADVEDVGADVAVLGREVATLDKEEIDGEGLRESTLARGEMTLPRGEAGRGEVDVSRLMGETASAGIADARRFQNDSNPPAFVFGESMASFAASGSFSTTRHPAGMSSVAVALRARMDASQAEEPFEEAKCASGLVRIMGRLRVSFTAVRISFAAWDLQK